MTDQKTTAKKPWRLPEPEQQGSESVDDIFLAVGMSSTHWETLQDEMQPLFSVLCQAETMPVKRDLGMLESVPMKIAMMRQAAAYSLQDKPDVLSRVGGLLEEIVQFSQRRNDIIHGVATRYITRSSMRGHFLMPAYSQSDKYDTQRIPEKEAHNYRLTAPQITHIGKEFERLSNETRALFMELRSNV